MSSRVDPDLLLDLKKFGEAGAVNIEACFNCGTCTAMCPLASDDYPFPRKSLRLVQLGLKDRLDGSLDPWLCYYCGDCTVTCPRGAEPAEAQMALRRWLTAEYDWTGLARKFYTSKVWEIGSVLLVGVLVILAFVFWHGPIVTERVELNTFAPVHVIHYLDWGMAGLLLFFLLTNAWRMYWFTMRRGADTRIPLSVYLSEAWNLPYHFATQKRWSSCDEERPSWITHILLVSGYVLMLVLIVFFLRWFQTDNIYPIWHPQRWLGYYATVVLLYGAGRAIWGRLQQARQMHRFSHTSDWMFPVLLFTVTLSGILVHIFRYLGLPLATYVTYVIHLALLVPMLVLEVPFGKWSHLAYRPLAVYFEAVKAKVKEQETAVLTPSTV
ncbi:MAG: 4Fe-4S dicluster domain-containing protein [Anaerolineales bacterium]|nr:4Fe-4S dicluster domain-containing protein [Anaerolineales bacterium]